MSATFDLILKGGLVMSPAGLAETDIGVREGRIAALGGLDGSAAKEVIDCTGLHVLPGVIDTQVHFREPGGEAKEDLESGSRAAVLGGVTGVFEMPNTNPATTTREAIEDKVRRATRNAQCPWASPYKDKTIPLGIVDPAVREQVAARQRTEEREAITQPAPSLTSVQVPIESDKALALAMAYLMTRLVPWDYLQKYFASKITINPWTGGV